MLTTEFMLTHDLLTLGYVQPWNLGCLMASVAISGDVGWWWWHGGYMVVAWRCYGGRKLVVLDDGDFRCVFGTEIRAELQCMVKGVRGRLTWIP